MKFRISIDLLDDSGKLVENIDTTSGRIPVDGILPALQGMVSNVIDGTYDSVLQKHYGQH